MAGAVVDDPVDGAGRAVGLDLHDLVHEAAERDDPGRLFDAVKQVGVVDVPRGEVGERSAAQVLEFDQSRTPAARRGGLVVAAERLQLRLLIGRDHVLVRAQPLAVEDARVEVQHAGGLLGEVGVAREDPGAHVCHGLIASSCSHRQIVEADASVTPRSITKRCSSTREKRESGSSCVRGSSHAIALTSATCSGGKTARSTRPRLILKPIQPLDTEPGSSPGDAIRRAVQPCSDVDVLHPLGRVENHPRPLDSTERKRDRARPTLKLHPLLVGKLDHMLASPGHDT